MDLGITGKVAVVTGAIRGIGKATALELAREGAEVAVIDVLDEGIEQVVAEIRAGGRRAAGYNCDVGDVEQVNATFERIAADLGGVQILVNNAAVLDNVSKIEGMAQAMWERDLRVNLTGVFNCTRAALSPMQRAGWGRIISISSVAGMLGGFGQAGYSSTKAAITGLMKTVALEQGRYGITANVLFPGIVGTEMFQFMREDMKNRIRARTVLRREAEPADIAWAICFLCSERARYISGICLDVSNGITLFTF
ncbi:MAG: SDR family NAD(P)-dependent oxidoreductase [bacterium]|nr:SDR family NAD(P)-dependent oxidoreductase [bacterium]